MKLKQVPYPKKPYRQQVVQFGGIHYGVAGAAGELEDSRNLSAQEFPCLSTRAGLQKVEGVSGAEAVFEWNGKLLICKNGQMYYDGTFVCSVKPGEKQFAAVGNQLAVWPDEIVLNLSTGVVAATSGEFVTADDDSTVLTDTSLTAPAEIVVQHSGASCSAGDVCYTYGKDGEAVRACWDKENAVWDEAALEALLQVKTNPVNEDIILHYKNEVIYRGVKNTDGTVVPPAEDTMLQGQYGRYRYGAFDQGSSSVEVCRADAGNPQFEGRFSVGDRVEISGGPFGLAGAQAAEITEIGIRADTGFEPNGMGFAEGALRAPLWYSASPYAEALYPDREYILKCYYGTPREWHFKKFSPDAVLPGGLVAFFTGRGGIATMNSEIHLWDPERKLVYGPYTLSGASDDRTAVELIAWPEVHEYTVRRAIPKFDYICAHNNRLIGADNKEKCVWVSALGKPLEFYEDPTLATGAWSVAVGSDGDFTGVCSYGGDVLLWKEKRLHKLLGDVPADFALYEYQFRGVAKGSHRSLAVIDEALFFKSDEGVCIYTGGVPRLISGAFGLRRYGEAVGGSDGRRYYICMREEGSGNWGVWVYDPDTGIWLQERAERDLDYLEADGGFCVLKEDGSLWKMGGEMERDGAWSATFCPMTETYHGRKSYSKLLLRYVLGEGATICVEISADGKEFETVALQMHEGNYGTAVLPIRPMRCDKFRIRISGTGYCRVESLVRKFQIGGEW